jgi:signal transduction histidine kinase
LRNGTGDDEEIASTLGKIGKQARRAGEVIRHLRRLVKQRESETEVADINALIRDLLPLAQVDTRAQGLSIRTDLAYRLPSVEVDSIQIQQVILNLIRNAVDAMVQWRDGNTIVIRTTLPEPGWIEVRVVDSGPGIPEHVMARLFEPFVTTKPDGLGVGVSICRSILDSHGGKFFFEKNEPTGTVARFTLPALDTASRRR